MIISEREQVIEVLNRLFYYTDYQLWDQLKDEVFADEVHMDMTSLGTPKVEILSAKDLCNVWAEGFRGLDAIHHQSGNYIIDITDNSAEVKAYAIASHFKREARHGTTREFVGSYDFRLNKTENGWRLTFFKFNLKYIKGNLNLD